MRTDCGWVCDTIWWIYAIDWHMFWTIVVAVVVAKIICVPLV